MTTAYAPRKRVKTGKIVEYAASYFGLTVMSFIILFPLIILLSAALKLPGDLFEYPPRIIPKTFTLENFTGALQKAPLLRYLLNSFVVAVCITTGQLITASLAGFAFARMRFPGKNLLFFAVMATYMVPWELTLIPNYLTISKFGLIDNYAGLILPFLSGAFGIFLLRQAFRTIPEDYFDAAKLDGATPLQQLRMVAIPLALPSVGALALLQFLSAWNQYLWPLLVTNSTAVRTAQIGLRYFLVDQEGTNYGFVAAGAILVLAPTLIAFVILQRAFVRGLSVGGIKG